MSTLLDARNITVRFGGVLANDNVSVSCQEGAITALIGPNGAGKTTFFDVITGARKPDTGSVRFADRDVTRALRRTRARLGMARTFQNLSLVPDMSVLDNVLVGTFRYHTYGMPAVLLGAPRVRRTDRDLSTIARRALVSVGLGNLADTTLAGLPYGDLRRVEIARALATGPRLLMLDEPAAGMDREETAEMAEAIKAIRDRWETTVLVVEHDVSFIRTVADDVYVLDFGKMLIGGPAEQTLAAPIVVEAYLGERRC